MTTEVTPSVTTPAPINVASEIDRMIAGSGRRNDVSVQGHPGDYAVHVEPQPDGTLKSTVTTHAPPTPSTGGNASRLKDTGVDIPTEAAKLQATLAAKQSALDAVTYDPQTGQAIHVLQGRARDVAVLELNQLKVSTAHTLQQFQRLAQQRVSDAARTSAADRERAMTEAFTRGDPTRAAALKQALANAEATDAAAAIMNVRRGR